MKKVTTILIVIILLFIKPNSLDAKTQKQENHNGDLSKQITITEVFPNPEGKDSNKEWIELYNYSDQKINLGNWIIKNSTKEVKLSDKLNIYAQSTLIIEKDNLKLSLKNKNEVLQLLDFNSSPISRVAYKDSQENYSYTLSKIKREEQTKQNWLWTATSKNLPNPTFHQISGKITKSPSIGKDYYFIITENNKTQSKILIDEKKHSFFIIENLLTKDKAVELLVRKLDNNNYILEEYKIEQPEIIKDKSKENINIPKWTYYLLIPITLLMLILLTIP